MNLKKEADQQYYEGLTLPTVRYQYPQDGGINPFDLNNEGAFFIDARGLSLLSSDIEYFKEPYNNKLVWDNIPMGYKALNVFYRILVVKGGVVIREFSENYQQILMLNPHFERDVLSKEYDQAGRYYIMQSSNEAIHKGVNTKYTDARSRALDFSKDNPDSSFIVARRLICVNWH